MEGISLSGIAEYVRQHADEIRAELRCKSCDGTCDETCDGTCDGACHRDYDGDCGEICINSCLDISSENSSLFRLPRLDLKPTLESTVLKLMEEAGELAQVAGKGAGLNGERDVLEKKEWISRIIEELLDVAQTATTLIYVLEEDYEVDIEEALESHMQKLIRKGYLNI